jgi:beta-phosphoglucomutase family hydrolase
MEQIAAIFDMDGTLIDNNAFHFRSWKVLFERHGLPELTQETFNEKMSGVPAMESVRNFFGKEHSEDQMKQWVDEKSNIYREDYSPYVAPINGLERFLNELKDAGIPTAVATSASPDNVEFAFSHLTIGRYFDTIIDGNRLSEAKPNPQIFLKAANDLGVEPENCVVFEDSISGVKAARSAGMKIVAITTTHQEDELLPVDLVIKDYAEIDLHSLLKLFEDKDE